MFHSNVICKIKTDILKGTTSYTAVTAFRRRLGICSKLIIVEKKVMTIQIFFLSVSDLQIVESILKDYSLLPSFCFRKFFLHHNNILIGQNDRLVFDSSCWFHKYTNVYIFGVDFKYSQNFSTSILSISTLHGAYSDFNIFLFFAFPTLCLLTRHF